MRKRKSSSQVALNSVELGIVLNDFNRKRFFTEIAFRGQTKLQRHPTRTHLIAHRSISPCGLTH